ncbi:MAG: hypothetical protein WCJ35_11960 [Planctomycetota bacterium]
MIAIKTDRSWSALVVALALLFAASASAAQDQPLRRWAVLASDDLQQAGVGDLLAAELSKANGIELVERERLAEATKELKLSALLGAGDVERRLKLGRLLGADALLLVSLEDRDGKPRLRTVASDCRCGARLRCEWVPYTAGQPEEAAKALVATVEAARQQFPKGVEQVIGVTHFVSKNLTHDDDHFQAAYACLLERALVSSPGVAVLEFEEARAIGQELQVTTGRLEHRLIPVFVQGEFTTSRGADANPRVHLKVEVVDGRRTLVGADRDDLTGKEAGSLLSEELPRRILALAKGGATRPLTAGEQRKAMLARAAAFSSLGAWEHSSGLLEAALLLEPDDQETRRTLVGDYRQWFMATGQQQGRVFGSNSETRRFERLTATDKEAWTAAHRRKAAIWQSLAWHVEQLIRARAIWPPAAHTLCQDVLEMTRRMYTADFGNRHEIRKAYRQFFWTVYPLFPAFYCGGSAGVPGASAPRDAKRGSRPEQLSKASASALYEYGGWTEDAFNKMYRESRRGREPAPIVRGERKRPPESAYYPIGWGVRPDPIDGQETLDDFRRFFTEVTSPEMPPLPVAIGYITGHFPKMVVEGSLETEQLHKFYQLLAASQDANCRFYGRFGLLFFRASALKGQQVAAANRDEILREADSLWAYVEGYHGVLCSHSFMFYEGINSIRFQFGGQAAVKPEPSFSPTPGARPTTVTLSPAPAPTHATARPKPRPRERTPLELDQLPILERISFEKVASWWRKEKVDLCTLTRCTATMDLLTGGRNVWMMRRPGEIESILPAGEKLGDIYLARWDGENVWVATENAGLIILSAQGRVVARLGSAQGMPPLEVGQEAKNSRGSGWFCGLGERLYPIAPGRCIAIGTFGAHERVWFGLIERDPQQSGEKAYRVNVFYQATKLPSPAVLGPTRKTRTPAGDAQGGVEIFNVSRIAAYSASGCPEDARIFVNRYSWKNHDWPLPLVIDVKSLGVSQSTDFPPWLGHAAYSGWRTDYYVCPSGQVLYAADDGIYLATPPGDSKGRWTFKNVFKFQRMPHARPVSGDESKPMLVADHGKVYCTAPQWLQIDPETFVCEPLSKQPHQVRDFNVAYAVSAHYGLVTWTYGGCELHRVVLDAPKPSAEDLKRVYPFVPEKLQASHGLAICEIVRHGGHVGTPRKTRPPRHNSDDRLHVLIPSTWRGGDEGLGCLKDIYERRIVVCLDHAPLTDAAMPHIAQLAQLEKLSLAGTPITAKGMAALGGHKWLRELAIEAPAGAEQWANDLLACLKGLNLQNLWELRLEGQGFTDASLKQLVGLPTRPRLVLVDTAISDDAIRTLWKDKRGILSWTRE